MKIKKMIILVLMGILFSFTTVFADTFVERYFCDNKDYGLSRLEVKYVNRMRSCSAYAGGNNNYTYKIILDTTYDDGNTISEETNFVKGAVAIAHSAEWSEDYVSYNYIARNGIQIGFTQHYGY